MTRTKSGFLKAGSIIAIVMAALIAMFGLTCVASKSIVNRELVVASVFEISVDEVDIIENSDGSITYKNPYTNERLESEDVDAIVELTKTILTTIGVFSVVLAIAALVIAVLTLIATSKGLTKTGLIVTQLVLSIFTANILTFAFMIVALCLKDKKVEENTVEPTVA